MRKGYDFIYKHSDKEIEYFAFLQAEASKSFMRKVRFKQEQEDNKKKDKLEQITYAHYGTFTPHQE
jgi:hypothetical protein